MDSDSGGRISGAEFRRRREALGRAVTIAAMATLAGVGAGVIDKWERGVTKTLQEDSYWQLTPPLTKLEDGGAVVVVAQRSKARGGDIVLPSHEVDRLEDVNAELDRLAR